MHGDSRCSTMDSDRLVTAELAGAWSLVDAGQAASCSDDRADRLIDVLTRSCDVAISRVRARPGRRSTYSWTEKIGDLRREVMRARRALKRARVRARRRDPDSIAALLESLRTARRRLGQTKARVWEELVGDLDRDPWGRPYHIVLNKREGDPRVAETLDRSFGRHHRYPLSEGD